MFAIIPGSPEVGDMSAKVWPHLSVVPWVQLGDHRQEVLTEARQIVQEATPLTIKPGGMMNVGGEGFEKRAQRVISPELKALHEKLLFCLGSFGIMVSHPEWAGRNYLPHITADRPLVARTGHVDSIYVIDNIPLGSDGRGTKVISERLGSRREVQA